MNKETKILSGFSSYFGVINVKSTKGLEKAIKQSGWDMMAVEYSDKQRIESSTLLFDNFINSVYPPKNDKAPKDIKHFEVKPTPPATPMRVALDAQKQTLGEEHTLNVEYIRLHTFCDEQLIFEMRVNNADLTLETLRKQNQTIQMVNWYDERQPSQYYDLFRPMVKIYNCLQNSDYELADLDSIRRTFHKIFVGNKMYIYSVTNAEADEPANTDGNYAHDYTLWDLTYNNPIGAASDPADHYHPDQHYYAQVMKEDSLHVYSNWAALGILNHFCVLGQGIRDQEMGHWKEMRTMLFLNALHVKSYLMLVNEEFREKPKEFKKLWKNFDNFDKRFNFSTASYTYVPQMIYETMRHSLEVRDEMKVLRERLNRTNDMVERKSDEQINWLLACLALLGIGSALNDITSYLKEAWEKSSLCVNLIVIAIVLGIILVGIFIYLKIGRKK
mgnify:CR=1 FL=1